MIQRSLIGKVKYVWKNDPALDREAPDFEEVWKKFTDSLAGDVSILAPVTKEGAKLTVFHLRPLSRRRYNAVMGRVMKGTDELTLDDFNAAVSFGLVSVDDFEVDGTPLKVEHTKQENEDCVKRDCLDKLYDPALFVELGFRILGLSRINP